MQPVTFRNSHRHLLGTWLVRLPPLAFVVSAFDRYASLWPWWWFEIFLTVLSLVTVPVLVAPVWAARFRTLTVDGEVLVLRLGWFAPETRTTTRAQVTSVQVDEPLSQRLSGVRSVTVLTSGATDSTMEMPALLPDDARALERLLAGPPPGPGTAAPAVSGSAVSPSVGLEAASSSGRAARAADGGSVLYRASVRDIVATSVSGGYVLVMAAAVLGAAQEVGGLLDGTALALSWAGPLTWSLAVLASSLGVMALIAARFKDFRIEQTANGQTRIAYGVVERSQHDISRGQVVAVTLMRTPADLVLHTSRLVLSTAWLSDGNHKRLVFPSMPSAVAARVVADVVGRHLPELFVARSRWWAAAGPTAVLAAAAAMVAVVLPATGPGGTAAFVGGGLAMSLVAARYLSSTVSATASHDVVCRTVGLSDTVTVYLPGTVSSVVERRVPGVPVRNVTLLGWAHRRLVHRVPVRSAGVAAEIRRALHASAARVEDPLALTGPASAEVCAPVR